MVYKAGKIWTLMNYIELGISLSQLVSCGTVHWRRVETQISETKELSLGGKKDKAHENGLHSTSPVYHRPKRPLKGLTDSSVCISQSQKNVSESQESGFWKSNWLKITSLPMSTGGITARVKSRCLCRNHENLRGKNEVAISIEMILFLKTITSLKLITLHS